MRKARRRQASYWEEVTRIYSASLFDFKEYLLKKSGERTNAQIPDDGLESEAATCLVLHAAKSGRSLAARNSSCRRTMLGFL